ncbi:GTP-binding protein Di-Ras1 [Hydra vulgaris]|uniref:GTP-binding protein Di-Ras1 n=1 Tax=Hydra vulgaris TaxID=6087 RepID=A0ABM4B5D3_HYDVU
MSKLENKSAYVFDYRITFLGEDRVGKSTLINQIVKNTFIEQYTPTVSNHITHIVELEGHAHVCLLTDTAGVDDFPAMRKLAISKGNAFVVVYSVDNRNSFRKAKRLLREIKYLKNSSEETRVVLVGNKRDLTRAVSFEEGLDYSKRLEEEDFVSAFVESCAKESESSENILNTILHLYSLPKDNKNIQNSYPFNKIRHQGSLKSLVSLIHENSKKNLSTVNSGSDNEELYVTDEKSCEVLRKRSMSEIVSNSDIDSQRISKLKFFRRGSSSQKFFSVFHISSHSLNKSPSSSSLSSQESSGPRESVFITLSERNSLKPKQKKSVAKKVSNSIRNLTSKITLTMSKQA